MGRFRNAGDRARWSATRIEAAFPTTALIWLLTLALSSMIAPRAGAATEPASHYVLKATLDPAAHTLEAEVQLDVPAESAGRSVEFLLASSLQIIAAEPTVERLPVEGVRTFTGINGSATAITASGRAARYRAVLPAGSRSIRLRYRGKVDFGFDTPGQEYARGFSETAGTINDQGVYLAGSTLWYPYLGETLFTFDLTASAPAGWQLISPGTGVAGTADTNASVARWKVTTPVDELHIVGGPLTRYARQAGAITAEVYLRKPDEALAAKYLESTARNLEMYRTLIGPYPYDKFALVENFWETGYGMPSFTLLGPQIIRFPFILTSSYPHEVLHNWWGNGVFVDYATGNWCEGLTAYHADHLYKEQLGQGAEYRRDTLKKYRDFVKESRDFPLVEFRSRHSPATEAVGYGKALMTFHMLRRRVGDEVYVRGLQRFYREQRGKRASFADLARAHGAAAKTDLLPFMSQWVQRAGAPELRVQNVTVGADGVVRGELLQVQKGLAFELDVPIVLRSASGTENFTVRSAASRTRFELRPTTTVAGAAATEPFGLEVDPEFDVFRLLDARETAPSLGQMFGEPEVLAVLPSKAPAAMLDAYRQMLAFWGGGGAQKFVIVEDRDLKSLPVDRPAWVFGRENLWSAKLFSADPGIGFQPDGQAIGAGGTTIPFAGHSAVIVRRHPANPAKAVAWVVVDPLAAAAGLARKLPHYGKYSWLGFIGEEPVNMAKGEWPAADSPLHVDLRPRAARSLPLPVGGYGKRAALARLPAVFAATAMIKDIGWLADPAREGRGMGTAGLEAAADYVAAAFKAAKLKPLREGQGLDAYFQPFEFTPQGAQQALRLRNVIGVLPGSDARFDGEAVIVSAHYDHLGRSGPGVRMSEIGQIHPGADDNASGVAVLLELARIFAAGGNPPRTLIFVAFSGEEAGLQGSRHFVAQPPVPLSGIRSVLNLDTVGRLGKGEISALATGTASEWQHVFRGITFSTGIPIRNIPDAAQSSDQQSFIERGIPGVQLFTSAHLDYHRPTDTADRIDSDGLVKVASVAREALDYLVQRPGPLTVTIKTSANSAAASGAVASNSGNAAAATTPRRVSFGLVPDYAHQGAGVRAESVVPDSPAARAGFVTGDVLLEIDGKVVAGLAEFSEILKTYSPGAKISAVLARGERKQSVSVELTVR
jgi:aminopeptidase N